MITKEAGSNGGAANNTKNIAEHVNKGTTNNTKDIAEQVNMYHLALGSSPHATFLHAIEKGWLTRFPNLLVQTAKQHCTEKGQTILGKNIQSKRATPRSNYHRIGIGAVTSKELRNLVCMDQLGRYRITSPRGNQYAMIMYDYNSGYINAIPMKSRKSNELVRAFKQGYAELTDAGLTGQLLRLDNKISKDLITAIKDKNLEYQLASPGTTTRTLLREQYKPGKPTSSPSGAG